MTTIFKNSRYLAFVLIVVCGIITVSLAHAGICNVGDKAQVLWKGSWYPATVLKGGDTCYIHYDGYGSSWDEWVGADRIKVTSSVGASSAAPPASVATGVKVGDAVQVEWKGSWWPAHVLEVKGDTLYIKYDGYDNSWNEWVGTNRYKK